MSSSYSFFIATTTLLAVLCAAFSASAANVDEDIGFHVAEDFEIEFKPESGKKFFEIPSLLTATVGHVFHHVLPKQENIKYVAKRTDGKALPTWLLFDKSSGVFWGVPLNENVGKVHIILKTIGANETTSNQLTLLVERGQNKGKCGESEGATLLSLVIDRDIHVIKPKQRIIAINNIAKFFGLPYSAFSLEPTKKVDELSDSSVILAGPGTVRYTRSSVPSSIVVQIGCDGRLWENAATIVHQLKQQAREGTITEVLGLPLIGWRVRSDSSASNFRVRRQADDFGGSGSGEYDDDYYDDYENYDDDFDDEEATPKLTTTTTKAPRPATKPSTTTTTTTTIATPTTKTTPSTTTTTTTAAPTTSTTMRSITTETFTTMSEPSSTHHHRHHHGQLPLYPTMFDNKQTSAHSPSISTTPESTTMTRTTQSTTTTATSTTTSKPVGGDFTNYDDDDNDDYEDEDDFESETEVPDLSAVDVNPKFEIDVGGENSFHEIATTKMDGIEFIPDTSSSTSSTTSTTTTSTTTTTPIPTIPSPTITTTTTAPTTTTTTMSPTTLSTSTIVVEESTEMPTTIVDTPTTIHTTTVSEASTATERTTTEMDTTTSVKQTTVRHLPTTTQRASTSIQTETIEYELKNFPPSIQNRLKRIPTTAGKAFSYKVPMDTFTDLEDGTDLILELLDSDGKPLNKSSWCQFNQGDREIYGLPLDDDVSRWEYVLRATDHEGASVQDVVEILVQNHKSKRVVNHEFSLYLHVDKKYEFSHDVDWALKTLKGLGQLYRSNLTDIVVRRVNYTSEPVVFVWTNDSLPKTYCPKEEIENLYAVLTANNEGDPSHALSKALIPELRIKKVLYHSLGVCETEPQKPAKPQPPPLAPITPPTNYSPILRNPVDRINATVGELLVFSVPDDTFYDPEDTDPRNLRMTLLTETNRPIPSNHWLQFDSKNNEFYGIPDTVGQTVYHLVCEDRGNLSATDSLVVVVHPAPRRHYNVEFTMVLDTPYESFASSANMQRKFFEKIRDLFGDQNTSHIHRHSIRRGTTIVSWYNKTLNRNECPRAEIKRFKSILVNSDHTIATRVQDTMDPEFKVSTIKLQELGNCKAQVPHHQVPITKGVPVEEPPISDHDDYWITFIVPAILIVFMLLLTGIVACVMYRRRRSGKMNVEEDGRSAYGNKGIPVIFQEELEEKPEPGTKAPVILKDEKPPLAPPEYSKSGSLKLTDDSEPYQPPPPPFTRPQDNNRQLRPKPTPTYRKPPPLSID